MREDLEKTLDKLRNPLMKTGLNVLHSLLESLDGPELKTAGSCGIHSREQMTNGREYEGCWRFEVRG